MQVASKREGLFSGPCQGEGQGPRLSAPDLQGDGHGAQISSPLHIPSHM